MTTRTKVKLGAGAFVFTIVYIMPFLPGPKSVAGLMWAFSFLVAFISTLGMLISFLVGCIWLFVALVRTNASVGRPLLLLAIGAFVILNMGPITELFRDFSRSWTISEADTLIAAVENFHSDSSFYPDSLDDLVPEYLSSIPKPSVMGTDRFYYENQDTVFELQFTQLVHMTSGLEFITYRSDTLSSKYRTNLTTHDKYVGAWSW